MRRININDRVKPRDGKTEYVVTARVAVSPCSLDDVDLTLTPVGKTGKRREVKEWEVERIEPSSDLTPELVRPEKLALIVPPEPVEHSVVLLPGNGVWQRQARGWYSASEYGLSRTWEQLIHEHGSVMVIYRPAEVADDA